MRMEAFFTDAHLIKFMTYIDFDFQNLTELNIDHPIILSRNGYGNGLAALPTKAPKCYEYLTTKLNKFCQQKIFR